MLTIDDKKLMVERFISGLMEEKELAEFTSALERDGELRSLLDVASGTEALLHAAVKTPASNFRYEQLTDRMFGPNEVKTVSAGSRWLPVYAVAATLVIMLMGGYIFVNGRNMPAVTADANVKAAGSPVALPQKMRSGKSIIRLTPTTLLLAEEGTKSRIIRDADSAVHIVISQGNACFDVAKSERLPITVATPHTAIVLNGSVTRVVVTELETEVSVLEGSVEVVHRYDGAATRELSVGGSIFADFTTLQTADALTLEACESRKSMFRAYVAWVQQQAHS
jgi:hypothetical protein